MIKDEKTKAEQQKKAEAMMKAVYKDGFAEINDHRYCFTKMKHKERLKVFGFFSSHQNEIENGNFGFLGTDKWDEIQSIIFDRITYNNSLLSRLDDHFEKDDYIGDYILLMSTAMGVISYPLLKGRK